MIVVLPTPGPPVMIENFDLSEFSSARCCFGASSKPARACHQAIAFATEVKARGEGDERIAFTRRATSRSE